MIKSFRDKETQNIFESRWSSKFPSSIQRIAERKLLRIHIAYKLLDLTVPPGNKLEKLVGKRAGQYSIRINDQWRICFEWYKGNAFNVEIVDYHSTRR